MALSLQNKVLSNQSITVYNIFQEPNMNDSFEYLFFLFLFLANIIIHMYIYRKKSLADLLSKRRRRRRRFLHGTLGILFFSFSFNLNNNNKKNVSMNLFVHSLYKCVFCCWLLVVGVCV